MTGKTDGTCNPYVELEHAERKWYIFIGISAVVWLGGLVLMILGRCIHRWMFELAKKREKRKRRKKMHMMKGNQSPSHNYVENGSNWYVLMTNAAGDLVSGRNLFGKILVCLKFLIFPKNFSF